VKRDELRAGLVRLAIVVGVTVLGLVAAGVALWAIRGGSLSRAVTLAFAVASSLLVLAGALAGLSTGPIDMEREGGRRTRRIRTKEERRERELLALGLIAAGVACFVVSITLG
jgi:hypothetical protein